MNRRGRVNNVTGAGVDLVMTDSLLAPATIMSRPLLGNVNAGFHFQPVVGDHLAVLTEMRGWASATASVIDAAQFASAPVLNPGESLITHADGRTGMNMLNSGVTRIFASADGQLQASAAADNTLTVTRGNGLAGFSGRTTSLTVTEGQIVTKVLDGHGHFGSVSTNNNDVVVSSDTIKAIADFGVLSVGPAPFDGVSSGKFAGSASGTLLAGNAQSAFAGNLEDLQVFGVSKFSVSSAGAITAAGGGLLGGDLDMATHNIKNVGFISDGASAGTGNWSISSAGNGLLSGTLGVTGDSTFSARLNVPQVFPANANFGSVSIGAPFDGTSTDHYVGPALGTGLAINALTSYNGDLIRISEGAQLFFHLSGSDGITRMDWGVDVGSNAGSVGAFHCNIDLNNHDLLHCDHISGDSGTNIIISNSIFLFANALSGGQGINMNNTSLDNLLSISANSSTLQVNSRLALNPSGSPSISGSVNITSPAVTGNNSRGLLTGTVTANGTASITLQYSSGYSTTPVVTLTATGVGLYSVCLSANGAGGFTAFIYAATGGNASAGTSVTIHYHSIG